MPVTQDPATDLREKAAGLFKEAAAIVEGKDIQELDDEKLTAFNAKMKEATDADAEYVKAAGGQVNILTLKERLDYYHGKATGSPVPWNRFQIGNEERLSQKT